MNTYLLLIVAAIYAAVAVNYWRNGEYGMCLAFVAYAVANFGFIWAGFEVAKLKGAS